MKLGTALLAIVIAATALAGTVWVGRYRSPSEQKDDALAEFEKSNKKKQEIMLSVPVDETPPFPKAVVEGGETFDIGVGSVGEEGEHTFVIKNEGEDDLILRIADTTCKCTMAQLGQSQEFQPGKQEESKPIAVPPGESIDLTLKWTAEENSPEFKQGASLWTSDVKKRVIKLYIEGRIENTIMRMPQDVWQLGELPEGEPAEFVGFFYSRILNHFSIPDIKTDNELLTAEAIALTEDELTKNGWKSGHAVKLTMSPGMPVGRFRNLLTLSAKSQDETRELNVVVKGYRPGPFRILPAPGVTWNAELSLLDFGTVNARSGQSVSLPMFVRNMEGEFKFVEVESDLSFLKVRLEPGDEGESQDKRRYFVVFEFPQGSPSMKRVSPPYAEVNIKTNHPDAPELKFFLKFLSL